MLLLCDDAVGSNGMSFADKTMDGHLRFTYLNCIFVLKIYFQTIRVCLQDKHIILVILMSNWMYFSLLLCHFWEFEFCRSAHKILNRIVHLCKNFELHSGLYQRAKATKSFLPLTKCVESDWIFFAMHATPLTVIPCLFRYSHRWWNANRWNRWIASGIWVLHTINCEKILSP